MNISLICTVHSENGLCNIDELLRIMEMINPEVVFEEIPFSLFGSYYDEKTRSNLETETIKRYLERHELKHIPVDCYDVNTSFFDENRMVHEKVERRSRTYRELIDNNRQCAKEYGFRYLNSINSDKLNNELNLEISNSLLEINDQKLLSIWKSWQIIEEKREIEMLKNIYKFCESHIFNKGLFFVGAAHRSSIITKIKDIQRNGNNIVEWNYINYDHVC